MKLSAVVARENVRLIEAQGPRDEHDNDYTGHPPWTRYYHRGYSLSLWSQIGEVGAHFRVLVRQNDKKPRLWESLPSVYPAIVDCGFFNSEKR